MIITKTPFRMSFCGGGSDLPIFYRKHGGCVLSTTINRYMYITIHPYFHPNKTALRYSEIEIVDNIADIHHSIFRHVLQDKGVSGVEISSTADVPSGTGLGSSSAFTVGLLHTLYCYNSKYVAKEELAREACGIEIDKLGNPIGKQDQYAAAFGGLNFINFNRDDSVTVEPVITRTETKAALERNLIAFYTGLTHDANVILDDQQRRCSDEDKTRTMLRMCDIAKDMKQSLENNKLNGFGECLHEAWLLKKKMSEKITVPEIDELYDYALRHGATGGKLLGAGGGGFLLFYCEDYRQSYFLKAMSDKGFKPFPFKFEHDGTSVVHIGDEYWR